MKKPYASHELAYRKMAAQGIKSWDKFSGSHDGESDIDPPTLRFLNEVLSQPWAPSEGKAIELGCGTGPMLRWLGDRGFSGTGIDVSESAVAIARTLSEGRDLHFEAGDVCSPTFDPGQGYDLALDGHCLHCITDPADRQNVLANVRRLLRPSGLFLVSTMCRPVRRGDFRRKYAPQLLVDDVIYAPWDKADDYAGARKINGQLYHPTRYLGHWRSLLTELRQAGFRVQLFQVAHGRTDEPVGSLSVAAFNRDSEPDTGGDGTA